MLWGLDIGNEVWTGGIVFGRGNGLEEWAMDKGNGVCREVMEYIQL